MLGSGSARHSVCRRHRGEKRNEEEQKKQRQKEPDDVSRVRTLHGAWNTGKRNGSFEKCGNSGGENGRRHRMPWKILLCSLRMRRSGALMWAI